MFVEGRSVSGAKGNMVRRVIAWGIFKFYFEHSISLIDKFKGPFHAFFCVRIGFMRVPLKKTHLVLHIGWVPHSHTKTQPSLVSHFLPLWTGWKEKKGREEICLFSARFIIIFNALFDDFSHHLFPLKNSRIIDAFKYVFRSVQSKEGPSNDHVENLFLFTFCVNIHCIAKSVTHGTDALGGFSVHKVSFTAA